jgi:hypothetical protein
LFRAFAEALEWALDRAAELASAYPHEVAIVERVRTFARKHIAGDPAHLRIEDLLFALGLIAGALERELALPRPAPLTGVLGPRKSFAKRRSDDPVRIDVRRLPALAGPLDKR